MEIDSDAVDYGDESPWEEKDLETSVPPSNIDGDICKSPVKRTTITPVIQNRLTLENMRSPEDGEVNLKHEPQKEGNIKSTNAVDKRGGKKSTKLIMGCLPSCWWRTKINK